VGTEREGLDLRRSVQVADSSPDVAEGDVPTLQPTPTPNPPADPKASMRSINSQELSFIRGIARVPRVPFNREFDYGWPADTRPEGAVQSEGLVIYHSDSALPSDDIVKAASGDAGLPPLLEPGDATANCDVVNVAAVGRAGSQRRCTVLLGQYESQHIGRWMRIDGGGHDDGDARPPLHHVSRGQMANGIDHFAPPKLRAIKMHWERLGTYLGHFDDMTGRLKVLIEGMVGKPDGANNAVVVMTSNMGQSTLLVNFVCKAKADGIDLRNVLVFATDIQTKDIAEGLGLSVFYDEKIFADMPQEEADHYGDKAFTAMMFAKVACVQLVNYLGYDVLFQDVDIVWYRNPVKSFFSNATGPSAGFDVLFQDDGARSLRYAPYSANSGFYYVRFNDRTRYLFVNLLYYGDVIIATKSHQQALSALLTEHASLFGLRVKTLSSEDFPGGHAYHMKNDFMKDVIEKKRKPWLFHMSWTKNKDNKLLFMKQMGFWYVKDQCVDDGAIGVLKAGPVNEGNTSVEDFVGSCCSIDALISCHYKDKPSVIPCKDSKSIDKGGKSFWK